MKTVFNTQKLDNFPLKLFFKLKTIKKEKRKEIKRKRKNYN